jgi:ClpP class serine protease
MTELFWLVILVILLQPVARQYWLNRLRTRQIAILERERKSRVILLVHRQETMRLLGVPLFRFIDINDAEAVLRALQAEIPIDLVLHTPGGVVLPSLQIARAIKARRGKVTVFVPHYAMSGGTLIALAADEIVMSEHAVLGPIDPQVGGYPAASLLRTVEQKPVAELDDRTLILADVGRMAMEQIRHAAIDLLSRTLPLEKAEHLADLLSQGTWTHDYPITAEAARDLGLTVTTDVPKNVLELLRLYPQPIHQRGGVEYLPERRGRKPEGERES